MYKTFKITTFEVNVTTKNHHYLLVEVNCSDVNYHINNGQYTLFNLFKLIMVW